MSPGEMPIYDIADFKYLGSESDFYANTFAEHLVQHEHMVLAPHRHDFYLSVLFTKGNGIHEVDFQAFDIRPGYLFLLSPGQVHHWKVSEDIDGYIIFHKKEFYDLNFTYERIDHFPFFGSSQNAPLIQLRKEQAIALTVQFRLIVDEYKSKYLMHFQKLCSMLNVLYIDLARIYLPDKRTNQYREIQLAHIRRLNELIDNNFKDIKSPANYAKHMFMTEKNLNTVCKIILNKTVSIVITDRVILEAKRMLIHTNMNVVQISLDLGYMDNSYFSRVFKKTTGESPLGFRENYRRKRQKDD
jgi:AraC family transcriptional activator of pobA